MAAPTKEVFIGAIFDDDRYVKIFETAIDYVNQGKIFSPNILLKSYVNKTAGVLASFEAIQLACRQTEDISIVSIIGPISSTPTAAISPITGAFHLPQIAPAATNPHLSDIDQHPFLIRMMAPDSVQSTALIDLVSHFGWSNLAILTSDTDYGLNGLVEFQALAGKKSWKIVSVQQFAAKDIVSEINVDLQLINIKNIGVRVVILNCLDTFGEIVMKRAQYFQMTGSGWAWIVTDGMTGRDFLSKQTYMQGLVGTRPSYGLGILNEHFKKYLQLKSIPIDIITPYSARIVDAVLAVAYGLDKMQMMNSSFTTPTNLSCRFNNKWKFGNDYLKYVLNLNEPGISSNIEFNIDHGPISVSYDIVNLKSNGLWEKVGLWTQSNRLEINNNAQVRFHGGSEVVHDKISVLANKTIRIVTIKEEPFVMLLKTNITPGVILSKDTLEGFCIDLLERLSKDIGFNYVIYYVPDGKFGAKNPYTRQWNGMVKELVERKADMAVASLTINYIREKDIDFTKPYLDLGSSFVMSKAGDDQSKPFAFLDPFTSELWFYILISSIVLGIYISFIDKISPFARHGSFVYTHGPSQENLALKDRIEFKKYQRAQHDSMQELNATNATWFSIASLLQQGGENYPRSVSGRISAVAWWMLIVIVISTYTANLAAFLTASRTKTTINSIEDLAAQSDIKYGTVKDSAPYQFLTDSKIDLYKDMAKVMTSQNTVVESTEEGFQKARDGGYAFIWDSSVLEFAVEQEPCDTLISIEKLFGLIGYGFGLQKSSPYQKELSANILRLRESGYLDELKKKWFVLHGRCGSDKSKNSESDDEGVKGQLDIKHMLGVFYIIYGGICLSIFICLIEWLQASYASVDKHNEQKPHTFRESIKKRFSLMKADFSNWLPKPIPCCCPKSAVEFDEHVLPPASRRMSRVSTTNFDRDHFRLSNRSTSSAVNKNSDHLIPQVQPPNVGHKIHQKRAESMLTTIDYNQQSSPVNYQDLNDLNKETYFVY